MFVLKKHITKHEDFMTFAEWLKAVSAKLGLTPDQQKIIDEDMKNLPVVETEPPKQTEVKPASDDTKYAKLEESIKLLTNKLADNETREKQRQETEAALALQQRKDDIKKQLDDAVKTGKIPADNAAKRTEWEQKFEANYDVAKFALDQLPAAAKSATTTGSATKSGGDKPKREGMLASVTNAKIADYVADIPIVTQ